MREILSKHSRTTNKLCFSIIEKSIAKLFLEKKNTLRKEIFLTNNSHKVKIKRTDLLFVGNSSVIEKNIKADMWKVHQ